MFGYINVAKVKMFSHNEMSIHRKGGNQDDVCSCFSDCNYNVNYILSLYSISEVCSMENLSYEMCLHHAETIV